MAEPLKNARHEAFAQALIHGAKNGWTQGECYQRAGYRCSGHAAEVAASRLLRNVDIQRRKAELSAPKDAVRRANVSAAALIDKAETLYERGVATDQLGAVGKAIELQGKLGGALVDRVEVGAPGDFSACSSPIEVIRKLMDDATSDDDPADWPDQLREMANMVEAELADRARPVQITGAER
ncbi:hypothetical protein [Bradyrhizobium sp. SZCCHNR1093]|uniref:hypothetical protein n=1 Tax=Bradyrhizobium sp. SZCCHNR1093 TaxID=3057368 RepID=UPI0028F03026|nr:hypothetical protein [Bradyrhizobium sp. SZCCHNR1093]